MPCKNVKKNCGNDASDKSLRAINVPIIINALLLLDIQIRMSSSGYVNVFSVRIGNDSSLRRVKFDSGFNVMAVNEVSRHDQKSFIASPASGNESCRREETLQKPKKVNITLSLNWSMPYQGGCSEFLISSKGFDSSICDWKNKFSFFGKYHLFRIESFRRRFPMRPSFPTPQGLR